MDEVGKDADHDVRSRVLERLGFRLDRFQLDALDALDAGRSVLVSAPTGSGKTVVADYAVARALDGGAKAFYTTPLKALSNQKFGELAAVYGIDEVGLLTGDVSHRAEAPVVVMTTEVLRNMLFARSPVLRGLGLVVLDEVHYLQDPYRGSVWEEVIILLPPEVTLVCLSATVSNAVEFGAWMASVRGPVEVVVEQRRPVELENHVALAERGTRRVELVPLLEHGRLHPRAAAVDERVERLRRRAGGLRYAPMASPRRTELIEAMAAHQMLPAIVFIFSRAACEDAVAQALDDGLRLAGADQRVEIRRRCEAHTEGLSDEELRVLGYGPWLAGLEVGVAPHHAGMIPAFREAVEDCFSAGLLQVVFATETLALGINMPARTVVIERLTKVRQQGRSDLTSGEYAQMTGRAGRRGLDVVGHAVVPWRIQLSLAGLAALATSPAPEISSSFRPTYNLAVNLVRRYPADQAHVVLDRSFAQFRDQRHSHALSRRLDQALDLLDRWGYVERDRWQLTDRGAVLARIYHESDLLVAEALSSGLFDGLSPAALAGVLSGCTYEARAGRWRDAPKVPKAVRGSVQQLESLGEGLRQDEEAHHLPRTRRVDAGLAAAVFAWAGGERLDRVLERAELPAGDFVRNAKQLIDLLRQLALVAPRRATAEAAGEAAAALERGVVAVASGPRLLSELPEPAPAEPTGGGAGPTGNSQLRGPNRSATGPGGRS
jgi:ATP-dependent RNA helicase HelY